MNKIIKTTIAMTAAASLFTGCGVEDELKDASTSGSSTSTTTSDSSSSFDTFNITKTALGFNINWVKRYEGYSEIIYKEVGTDDARGDGYPFTNNATGSYTLTCEKNSEVTQSVGYRCTRSDITATSSVTLKKDVQYEWLVSYGIEHDHSDPEVYMEYVADTLTIE